MPRTIHRQRVYECPIFSVEECGWAAVDGSSVARSVIRHPGAVLIVPVLEGDTTDRLSARVVAAERRIVPEAIRLIAEGRVEVKERQTKISR